MKNYTSKAKKVVRRIADDIVDEIPKITVNGGREVIIEGKCKILEYKEQKICSACGKMRVSVSGRALNVGLLDKCALVVRGVVSGVWFEE